MRFHLSEKNLIELDGIEYHLISNDKRLATDMWHPYTGPIVDVLLESFRLERTQLVGFEICLRLHLSHF